MSSALAVHNKLVEVLNADVQLRTELLYNAISKPNTVFSGLAPQGMTFPYIVIGSINEGKWAVFGKRGNSTLVQVNVFSHKVGNGHVLTIYGHVKRLLDNVRLTLAGGHTMINGETSLLTVLPDPDGKIMHGVVEYTYITAPT